MGCGASKAETGVEPDHLQQLDSSSSGSMLCDLCQNKFSLLNRKVGFQLWQIACMRLK
jgi:hypothetical protein